MVAVPFEVYLRTSYEPEMEYAYGRLIDRHVGEYTHSDAGAGRRRTRPACAGTPL